MYLLTLKPQTTISADWLGPWDVACNSGYEASRCIVRTADGKYHFNPSAALNEYTRDIDYYLDLKIPDAQRVILEARSKKDPSQLQTWELTLSEDKRTIFGTSSVADREWQSTLVLTRREP